VPGRHRPRSVNPATAVSHSSEISSCTSEYRAVPDTNAVCLTNTAFFALQRVSLEDEISRSATV
jgi:hypothetical protein